MDYVPNNDYTMFLMSYICIYSMRLRWIIHMLVGMVGWNMLDNDRQFGFRLVRKHFCTLSGKQNCTYCWIDWNILSVIVVISDLTLVQRLSEEICGGGQYDTQQEG